MTEGLHAKHTDARVIDTPLSESGIVGAAIGLAMRGYRPVCEIQFDGFVFPAFDQITTQLAKMHASFRRGHATAGDHPDSVRRRHRRGGAPQRVTLRPTSHTPRVCGSSPAHMPATATRCCARRSPAMTRSSSSNPSGAIGTRPSWETSARACSSRGWSVPAAT